MNNIKSIGIAGAGGIGSNLVAMLFDYGYHRKQFDYSSIDVNVYDDDVVDVKNLLHQNFKLDDIGKPKVKVLEEKYVINAVSSFMTPKDFKKHDVLFSCVDSMSFRKELYEYGFKQSKNLFWVDGRCTSRQGALFTSQLPENELRKYITDSDERGGCLHDYEKEQNISHALPIVIAGMMLQAFLNWLRGEKTDKKVFML